MAMLAVACVALGLAPFAVVPSSRRASPGLRGLAPTRWHSPWPYPSA